MKGHTYDDVLIVMTSEDNVATALSDLEEGSEYDIDGTVLTLREDIEFGHKVALEPLGVDDRVRKYGEAIGRVTTAIEPGEWVHTHNIESIRGRPDSPDDEASNRPEGEGDGPADTTPTSGLENEPSLEDRS